MPKSLNDTQRTILANAAAREDGKVLPLPTVLKAPAAAIKKTVTALIKAGLIDEVAATADDPVWQQTEEAGRTTLVITEAGLKAIGIDDAPKQAKPTKAATAQVIAIPTTKANKQRTSKQDIVLGLLRRQQGTSIEEIAAATGWQPHSVRGFMSGTLKKKLGLHLISEKDEAGTRRYHIAALKPREQ